MITIQCTPIQAARWDIFLFETARLTANGKGNYPLPNPEQVHNCRKAYQKGGIGYVCKKLRMSRVTAIRILSNEGLV